VGSGIAEELGSFVSKIASKMGKQSKTFIKPPGAKPSIPVKTNKKSSSALSSPLLYISLCVAAIAYILSTTSSSSLRRLVSSIAPWSSSKSSSASRESIHTDEFAAAQEAAAAAFLPKGANPDGKPREAEKGCSDRHEVCVQYARQGECTKNPGWMTVNCPASCRACHLRDPKVRCSREALNISTSPIYEPGDMHGMFETLQERFGDTFGRIDVLSTDPWVVTFDDFLNDKEVKALISTQKKWERSTATGTSNEFGETGRILSQGRTSSNSWCNKDCESHPDVQSVIKKIERVTKVPYSHYESFQVLRYELGQKYVAHHDYGHEERELACGPRILTFFLYLSDVEEGGETAFPLLDIAVKPKKGKALLWPSVMSDDPESQDPRTTHEAKPVIAGRKFAANSWIHLYDFAVPNLWGCTGTFDEM